MDIPRKSQTTKRNIKRAVYSLLTIGAVAAITVGVSRLKPAAPSVDPSTVLFDTVKKGQMLRQVRGLGTLVPEEIRWVPAMTQGRVERRLAKPGDVVGADTVLMELDNPEIKQAALDAESQWRGAKADLASLKVQCEKKVLDQRSTAASVGADYRSAKLQYEVNESLGQQGLMSKLLVNLSKIKAEDLKNRDNIEPERLSITADEIKNQVAAQEERVSQLEQAAKLKRTQVEQLKVRSGISGVLQLVQAEVGQQVTAGQNLARVADPNRLKAELKIGETQVKDILIGQPVSVDTRNGVIPGKVIRIDPSVQNGTRTVDAELTGDLPKGAVADLSVEGTIELERIDDIMFVGRPVMGQETSTIGLFKVEPDGINAVRVQVRLGKSSVATVEIKDGLQNGDKVILSDMKTYDSTDRIRLK